MANVIINDVNLTNIANAIRGKNGSSDTYKPSEMADAITNLPSGGDIEVEPIVLSGDCGYACAGKIPSKYIKLFGDTITTNNVYDTDYMFKNYENETIPFDINMSNSAYRDNGYMFYGADIKQVPNINNLYSNNLAQIFNSCFYLKEIPEGWTDTWNWDRAQTYKNFGAVQMFDSCYSLRHIDSNFLKNVGRGIQTSTSYHPYKSSFNRCFTLDEIPNLGVATGTLTSNMCATLVSACYRLKRFTFEVNDDGTPKVVSWKSQTIDLSGVGYGATSTTIVTLADYMDDKDYALNIKDTATYEALKDNPDSYTVLVAYSRYNRTSAVETINSLPDTSAYLATAGGTNTIKFKGEAGSATDGGAINTMTEEEIAVATAKGWTVSLV